MSEAEHKGGLWDLRVRVRGDLEFTRHHLGGEGHYSVHDRVTFQNHLFDAREYRILTRIVASKTLAEVFADLVADGILAGDAAAEFKGFVVRLHEMGVLSVPATDAEALFERRSRRNVARRRVGWRQLIYWKMPLVDPDRFLDRTVRLAGWAFSRLGFILWAMLLGFALWKCWGRFGEMLAATDNLLLLANVPVLLLALVGLKVIHEFGHAYACKRFGCAVPEMGVVMIFMTPCAYVDASASWTLSNRWQRMLIGLGGMYVEIAVAAVFALIWAATPEGLLHDIAVNVIVLASLVTLIFNLNPLMRFDGYYVFSDLCGEHNLADRSRGYLRAKAKQVVLGLDVEVEPLSRRQIALLGIYGVGSVIYKVFLGVTIVAMVWTSWPGVGAVLALSFAHLFLLRPILGLARYLLTHRETVPVRARARIVAYGGLVLAPLGLAMVPWTDRVVAPGVLEPTRRHVVRAPADGFLLGYAVDEGAKVAAGAVLATLQNTALQFELREARAALTVARSRLEIVEATEPVRVKEQRARVSMLQGRVTRLVAQCAGMRMRVPSDAIVAGRSAGVGTFLRRGESVAELHAGRGRVRLVLAAEEVARTRLRVGSEVQLRWRIDASRLVTGRVEEILPTASRRDVPLPLTVLGGGPIYGRQAADSSLMAERAYVQVVVRPGWVPPGETAGLTAQVRIPARVETLGGWIYQRLSAFYNAWRMT